MSATERVRELLDERGVEYRTYGTTDRTWFEVGNISWFVIERENGNLTADAVFLTPEQAIAATMGDADATSARQSVADLKDENAKLRELVIEVFECARRGAACETCKVNNDGYACVYIMRELGIEVDA